MKKNLNGEVYNFNGIYYLILAENNSEINSVPNQMFWCSLDCNGDMETLLQAEEIGLVTFREDWQCVGKITEEQYEVALQNFHKTVSKEPIQYSKKR